MSERRTLVVAIVASFVFGLSGGAIAAIALILALRGGAPPLARGPGPGPGPGPGIPPMETMLVQRLDLSETQEARVREILDRARPRYAAVRESTRAEIERVLTPAQLERWRNLERRFRHFRGPREPGPGF